METKILKEYLEYFDDTRYINRDISMPRYSNNIIAVIGPRRVGKTWFLLKHAKDREKEGYDVAYVNFEDPVIQTIPLKELFDSLLKFDYIYLDEIQNLKNWSSWLRRLHDLKKENIFITGSSSDLSHHKIPSNLRGRYLSYLLFPFSYKEIKDFMSLEDYIYYGGFPEILFLKDKGEIKRKHFALIDTIFYRDVVENHNIKNFHIARKLMEFFLYNYSNLISISRISKMFKSMNINVSKKTLWLYADYFKNAFLFYDVRIYAGSYKKKMHYPYKNYVIDTGLVFSYTGKLDLGRAIENIVALQLLRKEKEISYYRKKYEVDFIVRHYGNIKELIQVVYDISNPGVLKREIRALLHAKKDLNLGDDVPLTIITWDYEDEREEKWFGMQGKIRFVPLWKWLLG